MLVPEKLEETIMNLRANDGKSQELLAKCQALSQEYFRVLASLNSDDRACVQQYMDLCEDLEDRTIQLVAAHYALCDTTTFLNIET